ncbi:hypothetical protein IAT38_003514 [Cryptococcus sp. DSM 104549]
MTPSLAPITTSLLIINPNSSSSITAALSASLSPSCPPNTTLTFFNPTTGPAGISDLITAQQSTEACLAELTGESAVHKLNAFDGVLVCCFSDHPLIARLGEVVEAQGGKTLVMGMFHAGLAQALLLTRGVFGILATGTGIKYSHIISVEDFLGAKESTRFAGSITTGLGVVELQEGDQVKVEKNMKATTKVLVEKGARVIVLGCAGMCGMEGWVHEAAAEVGATVKIVDGARAGVEMLVGITRSTK